jgi:mono/diheme cytochrome c family protein
MPFRLLAAVCLAIVLPQASWAGADSGSAAPDPAQVQRMLKLLAGIAGEYREAFDDKGAIVRPIDIDETRLLLAEVNDLSAPLRARDAGLKDLIGNIGKLVDIQVPPDVIAAYTEVARRYLINATGVREDILPAERPSLARGQKLYRENCAGCHGANGAGDGPDAAHLATTPAKFSDRAFMRGETPRDAFNVIMLGRQKSGMPAWGDSLSPQQAWDLVSYLWSFSRTSAELDTGRQLYVARCAGCHGANGDPLDSQAPLLDRPGRSLAALVDGAGRSADDLFAIIGAGVPGTAMPSFAKLLDDDQRRALVSFVRTLSLEGAPGASGEPMEADHVAELGEVQRGVDAALDAHRRGDPGAVAFATNAYLRFEPLEQVFVAFRTALANPAAGDPEVLGRQLQEALGAVAPLLGPSSGQPGPGPGRAMALAAIVALLLLAMAYAIRLYARRPITQ